MRPQAAVPGLNASSYAGVVDADWVACSSPRGYVGLMDGRYSFQVGGGVCVCVGGVCVEGGGGGRVCGGRGVTFMIS